MVVLGGIVINVFFFFFRFFGKDNVCCYGNIGSLLDLWVEEGGIF